MTDKQCDRCGEVNPAEIHTCSPNYVDRRQWKYDPMTGEPLIDGWPLYSGLPQREWQDLTGEEEDAIWDECLGVFDCLKMTQAKLKEKNG